MASLCFNSLCSAAVSKPVYGLETTDVQLMNNTGNAVITQQPVCVTAATGDQVSFTVSAENAVSYQWYYSKNHGEKWMKSTLQGADSDTLTVTAEKTNSFDGYQFRCGVADSAGNVVYTEPAWIELVEAALILKQPETFYGDSGSVAEFSVETAFASSIEWYYSKDQVTWEEYTGSDHLEETISVTINSSNRHHLYKCIVTGLDGKSKESKAVGVDTGLHLSDQTTGPLYLEKGEPVTLEVECENASSYQWSYSRDGGINWYNSTGKGKDQPALSLSYNSNHEGALYRCTVTGKNRQTLISEPVEINTSPVNAINLKDYGAAGDGVTDDTDALKEALEEARDGALFIPEGTFLFSQTLIIPSGCHVYGMGSRSVLKMADDAVLEAIDWREKSKSCMVMIEEDADGCCLENFTLEGQTASSRDEGEFGLCVRGSNHSVKNMIVHDINYFPIDWIGGTYGYGTHSAPAYGLAVYNATNVTVTGGRFYNCGYECVGIENSEGILVSGADCGTANRVPLQIHRNSRDITIEKCRLHNDDCPVKSTSGLLMHGVGDTTVEDVTITECEITGGGIAGIQGGESHITITNCSVEKSIFNSDAYKSDQYWTVSECSVGGVIHLVGDHMTITDNEISGGDNSYIIKLEGEDMDVSGNKGEANSTVIINGERTYS